MTPTPPDDLGLFPAGEEPGAAPRHAPLADRMRPRSLDEVVGQDHLVGADGILRRVLARGELISFILWGPPGTGKTTLARIYAGSTQARFVEYSAVLSGVKEIRQAVAGARSSLRSGRRTVVFVDEIHRFNRAQQDAFLPHVETGTILLVGATTENPSFALNASLLSRLRVYTLASISGADIVSLLESALADAERGLGGERVAAAPEALASIASAAEGDARVALSLLDLAVHLRADRGGGAGRATLTPEDVASARQSKSLRYDRSGEEHFNLLSALHKSLRCSDADAALYWLERMLVGGEDPNVIARRMVRFASEDIGNADPQALPLALAAWDSFRRLGSPEGELALAQAALYLALAPRSDAVYSASRRVRQLIEEGPNPPVPLHIRNAPSGLMKDLGYGRDYVCAHDDPDGALERSNLPESLAGRQFYHPHPQAFENHLKQRLELIRTKINENIKKQEKSGR